MPSHRRAFWLALSLLILATAASYGRVVGYPFIGLDDSGYVFNNPHVRSGLSWEHLRWAFTGYAMSSWHPLTWLSHMLDVELFGLRPGGHHLTSLLLHASNTALVFVVLRCLTGALWKSALVAALFSLHPLRVESVTWVSGRKDVLSGFFFLLGLWCYARYARRTTAGRYLSTFCVFGLGLMAKPMIVTFPFVLLLLDFWPLGRLRFERSGSKPALPARVVLEKLPFFALSAVSSAVTIDAQEAIVPLQSLPMTARLWHACASLLHYVEKTVWPVDLAVFYPHPYGSQSVREGALAAALLAGISLFSLATIRRRGYVAVGWFWFLGMLVPVIGILQVGEHGMADRYTYLPQIGLFLLAVWGGADVARRFRLPRVVPAAAAAVVLVLLSALTWAQVGLWRDTETLFEHTLAATDDNSTAHTVLGTLRLRRGEVEAAVQHYREALRIDPGYARAHYNLAVALAVQGRLEEAIEHYAEAARLEPRNAGYQVGLGTALQRADRLDEAVQHYSRALRIDPDDADALAALGVARSWEGNLDEAIGLYRQALVLRPDDPLTHHNLGNALAAQDELDEAVVHYETAARLDPNDADTYYMLGEALRRRGEIDRAAAEYARALRINPDLAEAKEALQRISTPPAVSGGHRAGGGG